MAAVLLCLLSLAVAASAHAQVGAGHVVVKLREGSDATLERGELVARRSDLAPLRRALAGRGVAPGALAQTFARSPEALRARRERAQRRSGRTLPDLALYFTIALPAGADPETLAATLRALPLVESAEPWPEPVRPPTDLSPTTPDFSALQSYTDAAPAGIGSAELAGVGGATGSGTRYVDVEYSWLLEHEDLELPASAVIPLGTAVDPFDDPHHGTAVLGILSSRANGYGVTGMVPAAAARLAPSMTLERSPSWDVGWAIYRSLEALEPAGPGDLILIEQQMYVCGCPCGGGSQYGAGPIEWFSAWKTAVAYATAEGVTVVEAAGNGGLNLDAPACLGAFDRDLPSYVDSGAILVAAGSAAARAPLPYSNYGSRVDLQGIAEGIVTLGGGGLFGGGDELQAYQSSFGGSSGAAAMVAGAVLSLQGTRIARGAAPLEPLEMRDLLVQTGTPQAPVAQQIGPLPDLGAAYVAGMPPAPVAALPSWVALGLGALLLGVVALRARPA